jgi:hypothetical protein
VEILPPEQEGRMGGWMSCTVRRRGRGREETKGDDEMSVGGAMIWLCLCLCLCLWLCLCVKLDGLFRVLVMGI